jgi:hypothetical protein
LFWNYQESNGFTNILVIVDKLTKYALFIPSTNEVTEVETAELFFNHVITHYGIPRQVITDRDTRWRGDFWKEVCRTNGHAKGTHLLPIIHRQMDRQKS